MIGNCNVARLVALLLTGMSGKVFVAVYCCMFGSFNFELGNGVQLQFVAIFITSLKVVWTDLTTF